MVAAKTDAAHLSLSAQFAAHGRDGRMQRSYQALVWGTPLPGLGKVDASLARAPHNRRKMAVSTNESARHAVTHYQVQESFLDGQVTRLACHLETGRTHQIRVHMAHIGHPVLGDPLYGAGMKSRASHLDAPAQAALEALARQALHAAVLGFEHPVHRLAHGFRGPAAGGYGAPAGNSGKCVTPPLKTRPLKIAPKPYIWWRRQYGRRHNQSGRTRKDISDQFV